MANQWCLDLLKEGVSAWNKWKEEEDEYLADHGGADSIADLRGADLNSILLYGVNFYDTNLSGTRLSDANLRRAFLASANLSEADLSRATLMEADLRNTNLGKALLHKANLRETDLSKANFSRADLSQADLSGANLTGANLSQANLSGADLSRANLSQTDLSGANLTGANLTQTILVGTNLSNSTLKDCTIYGISVWDVQLEGAVQLNLRITPKKIPTITFGDLKLYMVWRDKIAPKEKDQSIIITVDDLKIAQFIYLILNNEEIRNVINTLTTKTVLILGRFTPERKAVLDALREALRKENYISILFDFDPTNTQTVRETVRTLAHLSHFIIADLTNPGSIPEELEIIVPTLAVPVQPILEATQKREFSMFKGYGIYDWVLPIYRYTNLNGLLDNIQEKVIEPAIRKARELEMRKIHLNQEPFDQTI